MASKRPRQPSASAGQTAPAESSRELTAKQRAFVREYLVDHNGKQAAIRAGYSEHSAEVTASKLLRIPKVSAAIEESDAQVDEAVKDAVTVEVVEVLRELRLIAFSDIGDMVGPDGRVLPLKDMSPQARRAISSIEVEALFEGKGSERVEIGDVTKLKLWSKEKALELLAKFLKMLTDKVELGGDVRVSHEDALGDLE
ncbi:terminase small subunit [Myxococcus sp. NMCA1]|uniref:terminase small subunit n=1 Tax=Myxococcus sp. NMCA1 TaxID=2996785 RepID=UPI0022859867|nr:terminase small subunit [Myxococcus sp. NMCA1]WAM23837.1 terminase small subunit [Myxococcus sp. NMCA1]